MATSDEWGQWSDSISPEEARSLVREFLDILNTQEESDAGHMFHPVYISSCRVMKTQRLNVILSILDAWSK